LGVSFYFKRDFVMGDVLPPLINCDKHLFDALTAQVSVPTEGNCQQTGLMAQQAAMFIAMIDGLMNNYPNEPSVLVPSLHALQQCLRTGWKPSSLPQVHSYF
jgi:hypothetical protein